VMHLNKTSGQSAMHRVTGSLAFIAAARTGWLVCYDPTLGSSPRRRLFLPLKSNLSGDIEGLAYTIETVGGDDDGIPCLAWSVDPVTMKADEALQPQIDERGEKTKEASAWLREQLQTGGVESDEIKARAEAAGISNKSLWRAKKSVGVKARKSGYSGGWVWYMPDEGPVEACQPIEACQAIPNIPRGMPSVFEGSLGDSVKDVDAFDGEGQKLEACQACPPLDIREEGSLGVFEADDIPADYVG